MFTWDKSIRKIDAAIGQVQQLFSSMRDVQMALPGLPVQQASAYLCQYRSGKGIATLAVFHMKKSGQLAFYASQPPLVAEAGAEEVFNSGLVFVETMGFLLADMDLHLLDEADRDTLWKSLPIVQGMSVAPGSDESSPPKKPVAAKPEAQRRTAAAVSQEPVTARPAAATMLSGAESSDMPEEAGSAVQSPPLPGPLDEGVDDSVNDLLAAVEALRAKRPSVRPRRSLLPADMQKRRIDMRQNIGRLLASL